MILGEHIGSVFSGNREIQRVFSKGKLVWEKEKIDYSTIPFTVKAVKDSLKVSLLDTPSDINDKPTTLIFNYSLNGGDWQSATEVIINENDTISILANYAYHINIKGVINYTHESRNLVDVYGNICSLIYGENYIGQTKWPYRYDYDTQYGFFMYCPIRSAENLILPSIIPSGNDRNCIRMFMYCEKMTHAPKLPATTLPSYCYYQMFLGCINLTHAPELPATTIGEASYYEMFGDCDRLVKAPSIIPIKTMPYRACEGMFRGCNNLTYPPELPATILTGRCYEYMFESCISLTHAPELPATKLVTDCYHGMFRNCYELEYIKCLAANVNDASLYCNGWTLNASKWGKLVCKKSASDIRHYIPDNWTVEYMD